MARHETITVNPETWTQLSNANVSSLVFQNLGYDTLFIKATVGAVAPTSLDGAYHYYGNRGEELVIADLFPGISGANRLYAYCNSHTLVTVSHA